LLEAEAKEKLVAKTPLGVPWIEPEAVAQDKLMLVHRPPLVRLSKRLNLWLPVAPLAAAFAERDFLFLVPMEPKESLLARSAVHAGSVVWVRSVYLRRDT
jgi:hypothetical protein